MKDSSFAKEIIQQINKLRRFPKSFIPILEDHLQYFDGNVLYLPGSTRGGIMHEEGKVAVSSINSLKLKYREAIDFLKGIKEPLEELKVNGELEKAALDHYKDIAPKGLLSHTGSNKSTYKDRIEKYCQWGGSIFEAIDYGAKETAKDVVINWLVDDGVPKRVHRVNLLNKEHKFIGIADGPHKVAEQCVVAVFAAQIVSKQDFILQSSQGVDSE